MKNILLYSFLITSFGLTAQVPSYVPQDSLVGWWGFNGNANDESGNGNDGTVNGATLTDDRFGNTNSAYDFDGAGDEITVNDNNNLDGVNELTISIWVNLDNVSGSGGGSGYIPILSKWAEDGKSTNSSYIIGLSPALSYGIDCSQNIANYGLYHATDTSGLTANNWHHIVAQNTLDYFKIFLNGSLIAVNYQTNEGISNNSTLLRFASWYNSVSSSYSTADGRLDDIGIWNRILDSCEIKDLYNANSSCTNGINEYDNSSVNLYPNPTNGWVTLSLSNTTNGQVILTDVLGKEVLSKRFTSNEIQLNLKSLEATGTYFAKVLDADGSVIAIKKLIYQ